MFVNMLLKIVDPLIVMRILVAQMTAVFRPEDFNRTPVNNQCIE